MQKEEKSEKKILNLSTKAYQLSIYYYGITQEVFKAESESLPYNSDSNVYLYSCARHTHKIVSAH